MNIILMITALAMLCFCVLVALWIGVYVALPLALFFMLVSAIGSLVKVFIPQKSKKHTTSYHQKNKENQIIDVEFEEIK